MAKLVRNDRKWLSTVAIASLALVIVASLVAHQSPATGYEINAYSITPNATWVSLFLSFVGGAAIIIHQIVTRGYRNNNIWLLGIIVILISKICLSCISYIRGYINWGGDIISQGGVLINILDTGHIASGNYYPVTHILATKIVLVSGIPSGFVTNFSTLLFAVPFILATYLLATATLPQKGQQVLAVTVAVAMSVSIGFIPNGWSMFLIPLIFYCYFKRDILPYRILLIILLVLYPFFHPLSSFFIILALLVLESSRRIFTFIAKTGKGFEVGKINHFSPNLALFEVVIFATWIFNFSQFYANIRSMWHDLLTLGSAAAATEMITTASKISRTAIDYISLYWDIYGITTILLLLSLSGIYYFIKQMRAGTTGKESIPFLGIAVVFLGTWCMFLLYLLGVPGLRALATERILRYANIICAVLVAFGIYELLHVRKLFRVVALALIILLLIPSSLVSRGILKHDPRRPSSQVTLMDMAGMAWYIQEKDTAIGCIHVMSPPFRFADVILGNVEADKRYDIKYAEQFTDHFAYNEYDSLGEQYKEDNYTAITIKDRLLYETVWKQVGRYSYSDFEKIEDDPTVDSLYSNGELDVYYIHGSGSQ